AKEVLELAAQTPDDPQAGNAAFEANILLAKAALRGGDKKTAVAKMRTAAGANLSGRLQRGEFEMNLQRALVDWGERRAVAEFYETMAPKTRRTEQFQQWAADIRKGINPDLIPTFSMPGCTKGPC